MQQHLSSGTCTLHAPAKINLCLELLGKRRDGYHELRTVMASIGLCDTLQVRSTKTPEVCIRSVRGGDYGLPIDESNLAVKSLMALRVAAGVERGAEIDLVKRIPSQAGLGGGSSDAAAALVAGARIWGIDWNRERLEGIGAKIGSDVPFFVRRLLDTQSVFALATGRGEQITRFAARRGTPLVLVKPPRGLSTAEVYSACKPDDYNRQATACDLVLQTLCSGSAGDLGSVMHNALQAAARRVAPWIDNLAQAFQATGCQAHQLSGSGSAYFGVMQTVNQARTIAAMLRARGVGRVWHATIR